MKMLLFIMLVLVSGAAQAQFIYPLDGQYSLLYLRPEMRVRISTMYFDSANRGMGGVYSFTFDSNNIRLRLSNYHDSLGNGVGDTLTTYTYPEYLNIRNSGHMVIHNTKDSTIKDNKGRVIKAFYTTIPAQSIGPTTVYFKQFYYLTDTLIYEVNGDNINAGKAIYCYMLVSRKI